jgi:hypothetical protein
MEELEIEIKGLRQKNKELVEQIEFRNRYIKHLETGDNTADKGYDEVDQKEDNINDATIEEMSITESDDGGLENLEKEDLLQYLHTVSEVIEEMV